MGGRFVFVGGGGGSGGHTERTFVRGRASVASGRRPFSGRSEVLDEFKWSSHGKRQTWS